VTRRWIALVLLTACADELPPVPRPSQHRPGADAGQAFDSGVADGGRHSDAAAANDLGFGDGSVLDAGLTDGGLDDRGFADGGAMNGCGFDVLPPADRVRTVLVGQPFVNEIRTMTLSASGELTDENRRLSFTDKPVRIAFVPSAELALVLGERGRLSSVAMPALTIIDEVQLPSAGFGEIHIRPDGQTVFVVGSNVGDSSGISTVHLACDGSLSVDLTSFLNIRLADSLAFIPGTDRAVLLGGQAVFAPVDTDDIRLLEWSGQWRQTAVFDIWGDHVDASQLAISPDGATLIVPNNSLGSTEAPALLVADIVGDQIRERQRITDLRDPSQALFDADGETLLISDGEGNRVVVYQMPAMTETARIRGIGLADDMAIVKRGTANGVVLVPSTDPNGGPNVAVLAVTGPGAAVDRGQIELGGGRANIPGTIAIPL